MQRKTSYQKNKYDTIINTIFKKLAHEEVDVKLFFYSFSLPRIDIEFPFHT